MLTHAPPELHRVTASMKVPPKRKGNCSRRCGNPRRGFGLNESPSEKEGKCSPQLILHGTSDAPQ